MPQGHSVDDYLETIYFLAFPIGEYHPVTDGSPTLASRVAEMLGISRASAGEMLKRLEAEGLIERGEQKEALLTPKGRERAEQVVRRHRLIERMLTDFLGYTAAEAHVHADELGDTFSDEMVERISERLGNPDRCPHGWPVDTEFEQKENKELSPLSALEPDRPATIVRLAEHDGELLHWFYDHGYVPGSEVRLEELQRTAGPIAEKAAAGPVRPRGLKLALTFDDGPSQWTGQMLQLLHEHDARATFFLIGQRVRERPDDVRRSWRRATRSGATP